MSDGVVLVSTTGNRTAPPAGRSQLAGLLAAEAADRLVVICGAGKCNVYDDSETIDYFYIVG